MNNVKCVMKLKCYFNHRPCCAVDPVESEEDRNKALSSINTLLEKADKVIKLCIFASFFSYIFASITRIHLFK